jgi:uncharacterized glyoxalase superfamily protein PhnB
MINPFFIASPEGPDIDIVGYLVRNNMRHSLNKVSVSRENFLAHRFTKIFSILVQKIMESLAPNLFVNDIRATLDFYQLLSFTLTMSVPNDTDGEPVWAMVTNGKVTIMFQTFASLGETLPAVSRQNGGALLFYIKIRHIRTFFESLKEKVTIIHGLEKTFYGATEFSITDNNNFVLTFAEDEDENP